MSRVLIAGAGIAGAATALALHKAGIEARRYEAHPHSSLDAGAFLTLAGTGMHTLRQIDADQVVAAARSPLTSMQVCDGDGTQLATVPLDDPDRPAAGYRSPTEPRCDEHSGDFPPVACLT